MNGGINKKEDVWKYINKKSTNECWNWMGTKNKDGYGKFGMYYKIYTAHRIAWSVINGEIPEGLLVCHTCDNRSCCNPDHMFLGTSQDNSNDMVTKNRQARQVGEASGTHKLTENQVKEIRKLYITNKYTQQKLGEMFGVSNQNISDIVNNKLWSHI